jgi:hypothetical protein
LEHWPVRGSQVPASWHSSIGVQVLGTPVQMPLRQVAPYTQALPSSHKEPSAFAVVRQAPVLGSQTASWQGSGGWQNLGLAPMQTPAWQVWIWLQRSPSSHAWPSGKGAQVPFEGAPAATEHAWQGAASQAVMQQTPSAQNPVWHSLGWLHGAPAGRGLKSSALAR